jgi:hypothetical protein
LILHLALLYKLQAELVPDPTPIEPSRPVYH